MILNRIHLLQRFRRAAFFGLLLESLFLVAGGVSPARAEGPHPLKQYMISFETLLADLQMLKGSDTPTDWKAVDGKLKQLRKNLSDMQKSDEGSGYHLFLDRLSSSVGELERLDRKKDPKLFDKVPLITQSCFQCHATHHALGITDTKH